MGFCISSYLADSIYKVDCIAEVFVLALKCQNSTSFPPLKEGCLRIMGTFSSDHKPLLWAEEDGIPKNLALNWWILE